MIEAYTLALKSICKLCWASKHNNTLMPSLSARPTMYSIRQAASRSYLHPMRSWSAHTAFYFVEVHSSCYTLPKRPGWATRERKWCRTRLIARESNPKSDKVTAVVCHSGEIYWCVLSVSTSFTSTQATTVQYTRTDIVHVGAPIRKLVRVGVCQFHLPMSGSTNVRACGLTIVGREYWVATGKDNVLAEEEYRNVAS